MYLDTHILTHMCTTYVHLKVVLVLDIYVVEPNPGLTDPFI